MIMRTTLLTLALVAVAGVACAQTAPAGLNPKGTVANPNATVEEGAVKSKFEAAGYTGVNSLQRSMDGTWTGRAMKDKMEMMVTLDVSGNVTMNGPAGSGMGGVNPKGTVANPNATVEEGAVKSKFEAAGYTGVNSLQRKMDGTWTGRAMKNNMEIAVSLDVDGNIMSN